MIIHGSMSHTYSGRRKAKLPRTRNKYSQVVRGADKPTYSNYRETPNYPSADIKSVNTTISRDAEIKREISKSFTVAPAYNKGAYQVISRDNVKDIGR